MNVILKQFTMAFFFFKRVREQNFLGLDFSLPLSGSLYQKGCVICSKVIINHSAAWEEGTMRGHLTKGCSDVISEAAGPAAAGSFGGWKLILLLS